MTEEKPVVYILRGDDREAVEGHLRNFSSSLGPPDLAEMNINRLEGRGMSLNDLRSAALALPFLTERRLVILEDALKLSGLQQQGKGREGFLGLLDSLPQSTGLVLVVPDYKKYDSKKRGYDWASIHEKHWLIKWAMAAGKRAYIIDCPLPAGNEMVKWVRDKAVGLGGKIEPAAAVTLAEYVGNDTQRAAQELIKLLTYVNYERPIDDDDVRRLTMPDQQTDIFTMVDAIGSRDAQAALEMLHLLLEEYDFTRDIFPMVIRQFRLIIQAREIIENGGDQRDVMSLLHQPAFIARKTVEQAQNFDLPTLEKIYQRLFEIDLGSKTGGTPGEIALDLFITRLAQGLDF
jgi:DNA polymerase-3 subunit delta